MRAPFFLAAVAAPVGQRIVAEIQIQIRSVQGIILRIRLLQSAEESLQQLVDADLAGMELRRGNIVDNARLDVAVPGILRLFQMLLNVQRPLIDELGYLLIVMIAQIAEQRHAARAERVAHRIPGQIRHLLLQLRVKENTDVLLLLLKIALHVSQPRLEQKERSLFFTVTFIEGIAQADIAHASHDEKLGVLVGNRADLRQQRGIGAEMRQQFVLVGVHMQALIRIAQIEQRQSAVVMLHHRQIRILLPFRIGQQLPVDIIEKTEILVDGKTGQMDGEVLQHLRLFRMHLFRSQPETQRRIGQQADILLADRQRFFAHRQ